MSQTGKTDEHPNPHLHDPDTGTKNGVPEGVVTEESKGVPDSGRHESESAPLHPQS